MGLVGGGAGERTRGGLNSCSKWRDGVGCGIEETDSRVGLEMAGLTPGGIDWVESCGLGMMVG